MEYGQMIMILSRLAFGAVATFLAIVLWSNTRDTAWMFIVMGTILRYGEVMYTTLEMFGIVQTDLYLIGGIPVVKLVFQNLPNIFFIVAFAIMILRSRIRYDTMAAKLRGEAGTAEEEPKQKRKEKRGERKKRKGGGVEKEVPAAVATEERETTGATEPAQAAETVEEIEEAEEVEGAEEVEEIEEAEEVEGAEEVEEIEEAEEVEGAEEIEETEEIVERKDAPEGR